MKALAFSVIVQHRRLTINRLLCQAILEDCRGVRVAPYNWTYPGMDEDYRQSGLDRTVNNWQQVGCFIGSQ